MSPKSRRSPRKEAEERPKPRLHAHQRIRSDTIQMEPPLTIDQHLSKYRQYFSKKVIVDCPDPDLFYQHHPLTCSKQSHISSSLPCTLLHPNQPQSNRRSPPQRNQEEDIESSSEKGDNDLLQLAQIVSTLG
ncbi:hypothetical protein G6F56_009475 [Rhizopus delemar]|nr:hypothetical protein G6F56_009475 [Rhizopus delemar]